MPFIIKPENIGTSDVESVVDATPNTVPERDDDAQLHNSFKFTHPLGCNTPFPKIKTNLEGSVLTWSGNVAGTLSGVGTGTESDPYIIYTPEELARVVKNIDLHEDKYYKIADGIKAFNLNGFNDVNIDTTVSELRTCTKTNKNWPNSAVTDDMYAFSGHFDGNGVIIYNMYCNGRNGGLFPSVRGNTTGNNISFKNIIISASQVTSYGDGVDKNTNITPYGAGSLIGVHNNYSGYTSYINIDKCICSNNIVQSNSNGGSIVGNTRWQKFTLLNCSVVGITIEEASSVVSANALYGAVGWTQRTEGTSLLKNCTAKDSYTILFTDEYTLSYDNCYIEGDPADVSGNLTSMIINDLNDAPLDWYVDWIPSSDFTGRSITDKQFEHYMNAFALPRDILLNKLNSKQIKYYYTDSMELKQSHMYLLWSNDSGEKFSIQHYTYTDTNTEPTLTTLIDSDGTNPVPSLLRGLVIIPANSTRSVVLGTGETSVSIMNISSAMTSKQFDIDTSGTFANVSGTKLSVWDIEI